MQRLNDGNIPQGLQLDVYEASVAGGGEVGEMAKAYNTKLGREVVALCRETLGGNGIVLDYGIASKFCDMEAAYTYEGSYDVCMLVAGRALTGVSAIKSAAGIKNDMKRRQRKSKL